MDKINGIVLSPLKIISGEKGAVLHAIKMSDSTYHGFGEAYFSTIHCNACKGWKKHKQMTLNLVVPVGSIHFKLVDGRPDSLTYKKTMELELSQTNYQRLTVPPGIWMAFEGKGEGINLLMNLANILHEPTEADATDLIDNSLKTPDF